MIGNVFIFIFKKGLNIFFVIYLLPNCNSIWSFMFSQNRYYPLLFLKGNVLILYTHQNRTKISSFKTIKDSCKKRK